MDIFSVIIFVFVLLIFIPVVLAVLARISQNSAYVKAHREQEGLRERMRTAQPAAATVISARITPANPVGERLRARLTLRVEPPGGEAFTTVVEWLVEANMQAYLEPGSPLSVKTDAQEPQRVYPNMEWAHPVE